VDLDEVVNAVSAVETELMLLKEESTLPAEPDRSGSTSGCTEAT
jgi:hypothetical protein